MVHGVSARDFTDPQTHLGSSTGVHGVGGALASAASVTTETSRAGAAEALAALKANNLSDLASASAARTSLGLDTAALQPSSAFDAAGAAAAAQALALPLTGGTITGNLAIEGGRPWYDVTAFGADPTGAADSTSAFTACIAAITGSATPATHVRQCAGPMLIPQGTYKVTSDLMIQSVQNFVMRGAGSGQTIIKASGTGFTQAALFIDGALDSTFEGFEIIGDGTEIVADAIRVDWTTAAARATTTNRLSDIRIRQLNFTVGISLEGNASREVDATFLYNVAVFGQQVMGSWSTSGYWQKAIAIGCGVSANNYDHNIYGLLAYSCYYAVYVNHSGARRIRLGGHAERGRLLGLSVRAGDGRELPVAGQRPVHCQHGERGHQPSTVSGTACSRDTAAAVTQTCRG